MASAQLSRELHYHSPWAGTWISGLAVIHAVLVLLKKPRIPLGILTSSASSPSSFFLLVSSPCARQINTGSSDNIYGDLLFGNGGGREDSNSDTCVCVVCVHVFPSKGFTVIQSFMKEFSIILPLDFSNKI
ncbi:hypothetical protein BS78_07G106500 [Paspalum vaginatum]|nr:hypothetical protein BS78_07G106500 [Paspalum vaginatum]